MLEHRLVTPHHGGTTLRSVIRSLRFLVRALVSRVRASRSNSRLTAGSERWLPRRLFGAGAFAL